MIKSTAPAKCILAGEHAVVYGAKAVAMPIHSLRAEVSVSLQKNITEKSDLNFEGSIRPEQKFMLEQVLNQALNLFQLESENVLVHSKTSIPLGAGLGSSASLSVALIKALSKYVGSYMSTEKIAEHSLQLEKIFHGSPSGLDTNVVSFESPVVFRRGEPTKVLTELRANQFKFALIDSLERSSTKKMIDIARSHFESSEGGRIIDRFDQVSNQVETSLKQNDFDSLRSCFIRSQELLETVGVVTKTMKEITKKLDSFGIASKPTGAGGGGMILALLKPASFANDLNKLVKEFPNDRVYMTYL